MPLQSVRATLPNVVFSVSPHEHTKCAGKSFDFNTPTCLPAEQGEAAARCQQRRPQHAANCKRQSATSPLLGQRRLQNMQLHGVRIHLQDQQQAAETI
jgi:hypothetical protein